MDWVADSSKQVDQKTKPVRLTEQQADEILSTLPQASSFDEELNRLAVQDIRRNLKQQLLKSKLVPTPEARKKLTETIIKMFLRAVVATGSPVGLWAGPGVVAPLIQAGMNSFHFSGAGANTQSVLTFITKLFKAEVPANPQIFLYFADKTVTGQQILNLKEQIVQTKGADLFDSFTIITQTEAQESQWRSDYLSSFDLLNEQIYQSSRVLRIHLDKLKIYKLKMTINDLKNLLEDFEPQSKIIPSTLKEATLDVHLDVKGPKWRTGSQLKKLYDRFADVIIQGLDGVTDLNIVEMPVLSVFGSEKQLKTEQKTSLGQYRINLNEYRMEKNAIGLENVTRLTQDAGMTVISAQQDHFIVQVPSVSQDLEQLVEDKKITETLVYNSFVKTEKRQGDWKIQIDKSRGLDYIEIEQFFFDLNAKITNKTENGLFYFLTVQTPSVYPKPSDLIRSRIKEASKRARQNLDSELDPILSSKGFYRGIIFNGSLEDVLDLPFVDATRTISNNMHEIIEVFGVEAARDFFVKTLSEFIYSTSVSLHPSYISFVADFSMYTGNYLGATIRHIEQYGAGPLTRAAFGYISDVIGEASFGASESTKNMGAAILLGQTLPIGTALGQGRYDIETVTEQEEKQIQAKIEAKTRRTRQRRTRVRKLLQPRMDLTKKTNTLEQKLQKVPRKLTQTEPQTVTIRPREIVSPAVVAISKQDIKEQEEELSDLSDFD